MIIVGCDYHPSFQQIAFVDTETGELKEQRLAHREEAEQFYRALAARGQQVRVGMEASGHARWFERALAELQFELCMGDASADLGAELGEPGFAATAVASPPHGASAHPDHESTAGGGAE